METYGEQVQRRRKAAGLTRTQLADSADLSWSTVWRVEQGIGSPTAWTRRMIDGVLRNMEAGR